MHRTQYTDKSKCHSRILIVLIKIDNFKIEGTATAGAAVAPCKGDTIARVGSLLSSAPCDYPGALTEWSLNSVNGELSTTTSGKTVCLGVSGSGSSGSNMSLVKCGGDQGAFAYDHHSGRISPMGNADLCVTAVQRGQDDVGLPVLVVSTCMPAPANTQQFQFNPQTGALRPKSPSCVAEYVMLSPLRLWFLKQYVQIVLVECGYLQSLPLLLCSECTSTCSSLFVVSFFLYILKNVTRNCHF